MAVRIERDPLGSKPVPEDAYYGIQTTRALENFPISGLRAPAELVTATILVKKCAAEANVALGRLAADVGGAVIAAADEVLAGGLRDQFVVDIYQAGAGTSHNMNANEVLANRAGELLGDPRGAYARVHPNDHVNMGQSTNDVYPTATRLALLSTTTALAAAARALAEALDAKAQAFRHVLKVGRTHLQDAVPMTLGQELGGYAACVRRGADDVEQAARQLLELNLGATAVGTGLNAGEAFTRLAIGALARESGFAVVPAANRFRVTQSMGDVLAVSGAVRRLAVEAGKVASDLRLLAMGPRAGHRRGAAAGRAARLVDHAGQGEPVGARDGQPGLLPGDRLRRDHRGGRRRRPAGAERHDAGHRVERAACVEHPDAGAHGVPHAHGGGARGRRGPVPGTARPQHGRGHGAEPVSGLRRDGRDCEGRRGDEPVDPRPRPRARAHARRPPRRGVVARGDDRAGRARERIDDAAPCGPRRCSCALAVVSGLPLGAQDRPRRLFPPEELGRPRGARSRCVAEARSGDGRARPSASDRWWPTSGPAAAGSRCGWPGASAPTAWSSRRTSSSRCSTRSAAASSAKASRTSATSAASARDPKLPKAALDAVLMVDTYHEFENPVALLRGVGVALKPGGRVGIVNFGSDGGGPGRRSASA